MPATAASSSSSPTAPASATEPGPSRPSRTGVAARVAGFWPTGLVLGLLCTWVLWLSVIMTHPMHPTTPSALLDSVKSGEVERWAFVEPADRHFNPFPVLSDPMLDEWKIADQNPPATPATKTEPASQTGWIAWTDFRGTHVAQLDGQSVTVTANDGDAWSAQLGNRDAWPSTALTLPGHTQVRNVADLWNGSRLLGPSWLVPTVSLVLVIALLYREPRFRTRWGWFWMLGAPLGLGFVWMLLREQMFGAKANEGRRPGGWTGLLTAFLLGIPAQILLSGIVPRM